MSHFDILVIGGGPAGCYAALTGALAGCSVALFEEDGAIGWPRHDPGWLMQSDFAESVISALGASVPWTKVDEYRVCRSESGDLIERSTRGGYEVRRDVLEKEIAGLAIRAGAAFFLKTRVERLIRKGERVEAVETNSSTLPRATGEVIICADGIMSAGNGFADKEGLCGKVQAKAGLSYLLANADVRAGVIEHFLSSEPVLNYRTFFTHRNGLCFLGIPTFSAFHELKQRGDNMVSRKIKDAYPIEVTGHSRTSSGKYGRYFERIVSDNVIFVGDASGGAGNIHGMIQAQWAAKVAAAAIRDREMSRQRLSEYEERVFRVLGKAPFSYFSAREDFGSFDRWFREVEEATKGIRAVELASVV
jgi:flavin-dependent dehydrogenase